MKAIHGILERALGWRDGDPLPPCSVKLGTTVATNALLERRGVRTLLVTGEGLGDVLRIGTQERPELFELDVRKAPPVHERAVEVRGRLAADGGELEALDEDAARERLAAALAEGFHSVAVLGIHASRDSRQEDRLAEIAAEVGFPYVVASSEVAREQGLLARGETACADAYLTPLLRESCEGPRGGGPAGLDGLRFMQSSGGLTDGTARFRGPGAPCSPDPPVAWWVPPGWPAEAGFERAIGFDMGGTSTDVSLIQATGRWIAAFETLVGGVRVKAPMLRIHTVAAGGGSLCRFDGFRFTVGSRERRRVSAGSAVLRPTPSARELAITDVNVFALGRIQGGSLPLRAAIARSVERRVGVALCAELAIRGASTSAPDDGRGRLRGGRQRQHGPGHRRRSPSARGVDPRDCALVGFGGSGGTARVRHRAAASGMREVLLHPLRRNLLSAYGIGVADVELGRHRATPDACLSTPKRTHAGLPCAEAAGGPRVGTGAGGAPPPKALTPERVRIERRPGSWTCARSGTETLSCPMAEPDVRQLARAAFERHPPEARFGYVRPGRACGDHHGARACRGAIRGSSRHGGPASRSASGAARELPTALRHERVWFPDAGRVRCARSTIAPGGAAARAMEVAGPALVLEDTGTVVLDPGFRCPRARAGRFAAASRDEGREETRPDPLDLDPARSRSGWRSSAAAACPSRSRWGPCCATPRCRPTSRSGWTTPVPSSTGRAGWSPTRRTSPYTWGRWGQTVRVVRERLPRSRDPATWW